MSGKSCVETPVLSSGGTKPASFVRTLSLWHRGMGPHANVFFIPYKLATGGFRVFLCQQRCLDAVADLQFLQDVAHVMLDSFFG